MGAEFQRSTIHPCTHVSGRDDLQDRHESEREGEQIEYQGDESDQECGHAAGGVKQHHQEQIGRRGAIYRPELP